MRGLSVFLLLLTACSSAPRAVPSWMRHIKEPRVDTSATLDAYEPQLVAELESGVYRSSRDTSPEQMAVLAVHELQADHPWDAAVLLALASYRRWEQGWGTIVFGLEQGWAVAKARTDERMEFEDYRSFVLTEAEQLSESTFDDALSRISATLGSPTEQRHVRNDTMRVITGHLGDRDSALDVLRTRRGNLEAPPPERLAHPKLAAAVREYLRASVMMHRRTELGRPLARAAANYLARVPLREYRLASLRRAAQAFDGAVVGAGLLLYVEDPSYILAALRLDRYASRSNAAVILGLTADPVHLPAVQKAWQAEQHPKARLSFAYALVALGEPQRGEDIAAALRSESPNIVEHAATLLRWSNADAAGVAPEALLVEVLERADATPSTRALVVGVLRARAQRQALAESTVRAMLAAAETERDHPEILGWIASYLGDVQQLDRQRVLRAIDDWQGPFEPWLTRLAHVVQPSDLPKIEAWIADDDYREAHRRLVVAAAEIPGEPAQVALEKWLVEYPKLADAVALSLFSRRATNPQRIEKLLEQPDLPAGALYLELALHRESAARRLTLLLRSSELHERMSAIAAVEMFGSPRDAEAVWDNVTFHDARHYLQDLRVRHASLNALIHVELNRIHGVRAEPSW